MTTGSDSRGSRQTLSRPREGAKIAGVCAGVARYFDMDVTLIRIIWLLVTFLPPGPGIIAYVVCWIAMPKDDPESLSVAERAQVVAYLLKLNGLPAGKTELPTDAEALKKIKIELPKEKTTAPAAARALKNGD